MPSQEATTLCTIGCLGYPSRMQRAIRSIAPDLMAYGKLYLRCNLCYSISRTVWYVALRLNDVGQLQRSVISGTAFTQKDTMASFTSVS